MSATEKRHSGWIEQGTPLWALLLVAWVWAIWSCAEYWRGNPSELWGCLAKWRGCAARLSARSDSARCRRPYTLRLEGKRRSATEIVACAIGEMVIAQRMQNVRSQF